MKSDAFTPRLGDGTYLVTTAAVQVPAIGSNPQAPTSMRVRCLVTGYLGWMPQVSPGGAAQTPVAGTPVAGTPAVNSIGMTAGQTEVFQFPQFCYFISSVANGFELTPGEGV